MSTFLFNRWREHVALVGEGVVPLLTGAASALPGYCLSGIETGGKGSRGGDGGGRGAIKAEAVHGGVPSRKEIAKL